MPVDVNTTLRKALRQLQRQREKIAAQIAGLENLLGLSGRGRRRGARKAPARGGRRKGFKMSAAARRKISLAAKRRWAEKRKQQGK